MKKNWNRGLCFLMTLVLSGVQVAKYEAIVTQARSLEYEGTTQFGTSEIYPAIDTSAAELVVDEVYISEGGYLQEGADVLKLTDDSYQEALDYYSAAIINAQNDLTNVQMEYDKAMQEAKYTYEIAVAEAEQADFVRERQVEELEDTIEEHEEVMTELEEAIAEYEEGIADGSYSTSGNSSSSGSSSSAGSSSKNSQKESQSENMTGMEDQSEGLGESEVKPGVDGAGEHAGQSESDGAGEHAGQSESDGAGEHAGQSESDGTGEHAGQSESDGAGEHAGQPESDGAGGNAEQQESHGAGESEDQSETDALDIQIAEAEAKVSTLAASFTEMQTQVGKIDKEYNEVLQKIYKAAGITVTDFCGVGGLTEDSRDTATLTVDTGVKTTSADAGETELPRETMVEEHVSGAKAAASEPVTLSDAQEPETKASAEPETQTPTEAQTQAPTEAQTQAPTEAQTQAPTEVQTQAPTEAQTQVPEELQTQAVTEDTEDQNQVSDESATTESSETQGSTGAAENTEGQTGAEESTDSGAAEVETGTSETKDNGSDMDETDSSKTEDSSKDETETTEAAEETETEDSLDDLIVKLSNMETERYRLYQQLAESEKALAAARTELAQLKMEKEDSQDSEYPENADQSEGDSQPESGGQSESDNQPESGDQSESDNQPESGDQSDSGNQPQDGTQPGIPGAEDQDETQTGQTGTPGAGDAQIDMSDSTEQSGATGSFPHMSGNSAAGGISGFSGASGSTAGGMAGLTGAAVSGGAAAASGGASQLSMGGQVQSSDSDTSLFGDEYDLTEVQNLLEREVSTEDEAEEILEQLQKWQETVAEQYAELVREEEATRLDIQYTFDCAVIEGRQAEITYQDEVESQEETLQEAKDKLADLEEEKALLDAMTNGVVTAEQAGYVAAVNYESEDVLNVATALYSIYNMETATVPIEVPQEEIALFAVGDTVEVTVGGIWNQEGIISAKAADSTGEGSRTSINYEVEVSIDNSSSRLSSQSAAVIAINSENEEVSENE